MLFAVIPFSPQESLKEHLDRLGETVYRVHGPQVYFVSYDGTTRQLTRESQWILHALTQMQANMDKLDQRTRRIEKMLWTIIGAASLVTLLFGNEILAFFRGLLANN